MYNLTGTDSRANDVVRLCEVIPLLSRNSFRTSNAANYRFLVTDISSS